MSTWKRIDGTSTAPIMYSDTRGYVIRLGARRWECWAKQSQSPDNPLGTDFYAGETTTLSSAKMRVEAQS